MKNILNRRASFKRFQKFTTIYVLLFVVFFCHCTTKVDSTEIEVRVNQVGYPVTSQKLVAVVNSEIEEFSIINENNEVVYSDTLTAPEFWDKSEESVSIADFSDLTISGFYRLKIGDMISDEFEIKNNIYSNLSKASVRAFYFNRASTNIHLEFGGEYTREPGHPDTTVVVHSSAASKERPAGTTLSSPQGWYDAGDYNKYIVNSGITTFTLLRTFEDSKDFYSDNKLGIPEGRNEIPDLLDEILWNLRWMRTMQDPNDGGVYHKLTTANFESFVSPGEATSTRYVVAKGTAATLDFAAIMAYASRIYKPYDSTLAGDYLSASRYAFDWAVENPNVEFKNPKGEDGFPDVVTGEYGDKNFEDEFFWAASELFVTTRDSLFLDILDIRKRSFAQPSWPNVGSLGLITLARNENDLKDMAKAKLESLANNYADLSMNSPYRISLDFFQWGSNSDILNQGMIMLQAFSWTGDQKYLNGAQSALDYVLGKNATGYCFVTGFGSKYPMNLHHRVAESDDATGPIPGFIAGGPNPNNAKQDCGESEYSSLLPAKCYVDAVCSYSTNEIAINWNAPLAYVSSTLNTIYTNENSPK